MKLDKQKVAKLIEAPALPPIPPAPWVERNGSDVTITANGLKAIFAWALRGRTQAAIAAELGITICKFENILGKADAEPASAARLAWESGFSTHKSLLIERLTERAFSGDQISGFFLLKAVHQLRDQGAAINVDVGNKI